MGFWILGALYLLAAVAAATASHRIYGRGLTSLVAAMGIWMILVAVPPYYLGWLGYLTASSVGILSAFASLSVLAVSLWRCGKNRFVFVRDALFAMAVVPIKGIRETWKTRSLVLLGLITIVLLACYTAFISYLAPSHSWDGLWYHDTIVGYAIQNHGFTWVPGPKRMEFVNGYPRMSETFNLFAAVFVGKYLIDSTASAMMIISFCAMVAILRPLTDSGVHAMGWASSLVLLPAVFLALSSSLTDTTFMAGFLCSLFFMTRPAFRISDIVLGGLLTGMMGAMKGTGLAIAPILLLIAAWRIIERVKQMRMPVTIFSLTVILFSATTLLAPTYVRNWIRTDNPVWPLKMTVAGVTFHGPQKLKMSRPNALKELFSSPKKMQLVDTRDNGYGNTLPFVLPLLVLAALVLLFRQLVARKFESSQLTILWTLLAVAPSIATSPAGWWWARLNLYAIAVFIMLAAWVLGQSNQRNLSESLMGILIFGSLMTLVWTQPTWEMPPERLFRLLKRSPDYREKLLFWGTMSPKETTQKKERELKKGDVIAYDGALKFPSNLWNIDFSNKVVYLDPKNRTLESLDRVEAKWVVVKKKTTLEKKLSRNKNKWQRVGTFHNKNLAYRRRLPSPQKN